MFLACFVMEESRTYFMALIVIRFMTEISNTPNLRHRVSYSQHACNYKHIT
jgi:hypothetical protein